EPAGVLERDDIRHRLGDDQPRFVDRPDQPREGPRPALRFPLGSYDDLNTIERPPVVPVEPRSESPELSHWAGSAAEEVPNMNRRDPRHGDDAWPGYEAEPVWGDEATRVPPSGGPHGGWADPVPPPAGGSGRGPAPVEGPAPGYDETVAPPPGRSVFPDPAAGAPAAGYD